MKAISDGEGQSLEGGTLEIEAGVGEGLSAGVWGATDCQKVQRT